MGLSRSIVDTAGDFTQQAWYADGLLLSSTDQTLNVTVYTYDLANRQESVEDARGDFTYTTYYPDGQVETRATPGRVTTYVYDRANRQTETIDALGRITTTAYNSRSLVTQVLDPAGDHVAYDYDRAQRQTERIEPGNYVNTTVYDAGGRAIAQVDPAGALTTYSYDCLDRLRDVQNPVGCRATTIYDELGLKWVEIDGLSRRTTYTYDLANRLVATMDPAGNVTTNVYDALGLVIATVDGEGRRTSYTYDLANRRDQLKNPLGEIITWTYDAAGRVRTERDQLGRVTTYAYDGVGNRTLKLDPRGIAVTMTYNPQNQLTGQQYPDGTRHTFTYDAVGNRLTAQDATGVTSYTYDSRNLVRTQVYPSGKTATYTYDARQLRTVLQDPDGKRTTYTHDAVGRLESVTNPQGKVTTQVYDPAGRMIRRAHGNQSVTSYTYDCGDQLRQLHTYDSGGLTINQFTYTYDQAGNRRQVDEHSGAVTTWTYDRSYQLVHEHRSGSPNFNVTYTYDLAGNRHVQNDSGALTTYTYDAANQLLQEEAFVGITSYTYDEAGNRTMKDAPAGITYYAWDYDGRLASAEPPTGIVTFTYNAEDKRVKKETPSDIKQFYYDQHRLLLELDGAGDTDLFFTSTIDEYGDLLSEYDGAAASYHTYDALGSTDALLSDAEAETDRYAYRAFGQQEQHTGASESSFTYVGQQNYYRDEELDLYLAGLRHLDPQTGQFTSKDPIGIEADDPNYYRYVGNNPTNKVDPSGKEPDPAVVFEFLSVEEKWRHWTKLSDVQRRAVLNRRIERATASAVLNGASAREQKLLPTREHQRLHNLLEEGRRLSHLSAEGRAMRDVNASEVQRRRITSLNEDLRILDEGASEVAGAALKGFQDQTWRNIALRQQLEAQLAAATKVQDRLAIRIQIRGLDLGIPPIGRDAAQAIAEAQIPVNPFTAGHHEDFDWSRRKRPVPHLKGYPISIDMGSFRFTWDAEGKVHVYTNPVKSPREREIAERISPDAPESIGIYTGDKREPTQAERAAVNDLVGFATQEVMGEWMRNMLRTLPTSMQQEYERTLATFLVLGGGADVMLGLEELQMEGASPEEQFGYLVMMAAVATLIEKLTAGVGGVLAKRLKSWYDDVGREMLKKLTPKSQSKVAESIAKRAERLTPEQLDDFLKAIEEATTKDAAKVTDDVIEKIADDTMGLAPKPARPLTIRPPHLKAGQPLADDDIITMIGGNSPGKFKLQAIDFAPLEGVSAPGKSASIAIDLTPEKEVLQAFGRHAAKGDIVLAAQVKDIRAVGFDVVYAPTTNNVVHVRIIEKTAKYTATGSDELFVIFERMAKKK